MAGTVDLPKLQEGQTSYAGIPAAVFVVGNSIKVNFLNISKRLNFNQKQMFLINDFLNAFILFINRMMLMNS